MQMQSKKIIIIHTNEKPLTWTDDEDCECVFAIGVSIKKTSGMWRKFLNNL